MDMPLVPDSMAEYWTVIHDSGDIIEGSEQGTAFTSRRAFELWSQGEIITARPWVQPGALGAEVALLVPNPHLLILEEAWGWKFPGECPRMSSALDGLAVLRELLGGDLSPAQRAFISRGHSSNDKLLMSSSPVELFLWSTSAHTEAVVYRRLFTWSPDAVVNAEGRLVLTQGFDGTPAIAVQRDGSRHHIAGRTALSTAPGQELMLLPDTYLRGSIWNPQETTRQAPAYLGALA